MFELVKGKCGTTSFLPIDSKTGGKISYIKNNEAMFLSEKPANYVYKKVEEGNVINTKTMKHEIEQEMDREDDNPYKKVILNKVYKEEDKTPQMEKLVQQHKELYLKLKGEESEMLQVDFGINPETLKSNYLRHV